MSEIGVIGQMYEDRRTKKKGKLVERDDKYKTLLMESEDGKSFNVSFGGFKSNWRSCESEETTIEEEMEEVEVPEEPVEEVVEPKKKPRKKPAERQASHGLEDATLRILDYVKSFNNEDVVSGLVPDKRRISVKAGRNRVLVVTHMTRKDNYQVSVTESLFLSIKDKKYVKQPKYNENWNIGVKYTFTIDLDKLETLLEDLRMPIINSMCKEEE